MKTSEFVSNGSTVWPPTNLSDDWQRRVFQRWKPDIPYLASYKGPAQTLAYKVTHKVITAVTRSIYSHDEIVLNGIGYSSSQRDGGVRSKEIDFNNGHWDFVPLPWISVEQIFHHYVDTLGNGYDFWGLRLFLGFDVVDDPEKWWCSEWCAAAMGYQDTRVSPGTVHKQTLEEYWSRYGK